MGDHVGFQRGTMGAEDGVNFAEEARTLKTGEELDGLSEYVAQKFAKAIRRKERRMRENYNCTGDRKTSNGQGGGDTKGTA